jgi:hypothetical protein
MLTGIRASGTYVTMSQNQWQYTQPPKGPRICSTYTTGELTRVTT